MRVLPAVESGDLRKRLHGLERGGNLGDVRALIVRLERTLPEASLMPRLLRAAPQLRQLTLDVYFRENSRWDLSDAFAPVWAFPGLVYPRLRHVVISMSPLLDVLMPRGYGVWLRHRNFPGLRRFTVDDEEYPVWVLQRSRRRDMF
jgi:hypothetical protein